MFGTRVYTQIYYYLSTFCIIIVKSYYFLYIKILTLEEYIQT